MPTKRVEAASEKAVAALEPVVAGDRSVPALRAGAQAIVSLRKLFQYRGMPDWTGRSPEYRSCIDGVYHRAGVPSDSEGDVQAKLRYHLGNVLREVAPHEDLEALGLSVKPPSNRNSSAARARIPAGSVTDAGLLIDHALADVRTLRGLDDLDRAAVVNRLRGLVDEVFAVIADLS